MSIFITNLAFKTDPALINSSKMAILLTSLVAGIVGYFWLISVGKVEGYTDENVVAYQDES
jgi:NhaA family Na+:H+ antiporter